MLENIPIRDGEIKYMKHFLSQENASKYMQKFLHEIVWEQPEIKIYGKKHALRRKTAWFGNQRFNYKESNTFLNPKPWTDDLLHIKTAIENLLEKYTFNSVLLNLYENGQDYINWHSDNKVGLSNDSMIASLSLGAARKFQCKHKKNTNEKFEIPLTSGALVVMNSEFQEHWLHRVPPEKKSISPRINLTFRNLQEK